MHEAFAFLCSGVARVILLYNLDETTDSRHIKAFIISKLDKNEKIQQNQPVKVDTPEMTYFESSNLL
jgi:hypothetical protein